MPPLLEAVAVVFGIVSVWFSVREHVWSWPTAIVNVALYFVIFHEQKLYADMGLQVFYAGISLYGWHHWLYGGANRTVLPVSKTPRVLWIVLPALWVATALGVGRLLSVSTDAVVPYADAALTAGSLIAQWMMTRKYLENWAIWMALDVGYVVLFLSRGLPLTAFLYAVYFGLATKGLIDWSRSLRAPAPEA